MKTKHPSDRSHSDRVIQAVEAGDAAKKTFVEASWARSTKLHNLSPDDLTRTDQFEDSEVQQRRDQEGRLLTIAQNTLDQLHATLSLAGCGIILTDKDGVILETRVSGSDESAFESAGLAVGGVWSEEAQGTNGIGTSIAETRQTSIIKDQHFRSTNTSMSCFGAPVFDVDGSLMAILDISSCRSDLDKALAVLIERMVADAAASLLAEPFSQINDCISWVFWVEKSRPHFPANKKLSIQRHIKLLCGTHFE